MSNNGKRSLFDTWDQVLGAAWANREDLAIVEEPRAQLEASAQDLRALQAERVRLSAEMRRKTEEIQSLIERGNELVGRIRAGAKSRYGIHSEKLTEFGMTPVQRQRSRDHPGEDCRETGAPRNPTAP